MIYYVSKTELSHHGVKGMKWGVRHDRQESGRKHSTKNDSTSKKKGLSKKQKIALGIAAVAITGVVLYKTGAFEKVANIGRKAVNSDFGGNASSNISNLGNIGREFNDVRSDLSMIQSINKSNNLDGNCFHTTTSYILNSLYGKKTTAKPFSGIDEFSGLNSGTYGRDWHLYKSIFNNIKVKDYREEYGRVASFASAMSDIKNGSTGVLHVPGHFINYERSLSGELTLIDPQRHYNNIIKVTPNNMQSISNSINVVRILDFSDSSLTNNATNILKHIVN